jgi:hypothetical protein
MYQFTSGREGEIAVIKRKNVIRGYRAAEAVCPDQRAAGHDCNNLLQTAISGLELIQLRTEQGRSSEILPIIPKIQAALGRVAVLTSRLPVTCNEISEIDAPLDGVAS